MQLIWFLLKHLIFLFLFSFSLVQCKSKKKFESDKKAQLVDPAKDSSPQSVKDVHRPVSQGVPTIHPDISKAPPPKR
ncbi:hypothetical protein CAEBREN_23834 [Caenorhabditis brenneri]|uniref:Uncharacterized protein n=1 Tax=Caenorhabditis brenneri TaxID=135651 RepID=G0ME28_CAEBE|nr:hypothetical protein CAEBREN_23834 [Caenorhabditis brenneri]